MGNLNTESALLLVGILLLTTVLAGSLSSRFGLPALIGFLGLGMLAGIDGPGGIAFSNFSFAQSVGTVSLIFILFSGGMDTAWSDVRRVAAPALLLATIGVFVSAGIVAGAAILLIDASLFEAALLGAIIASTDAAAVFAILRSTGLDLHGDVPALIEVESGSNDPMAIFLVGAVLLFIATPDASPLALVPEFVVQMAMGGVVGLAVGFGMPWLLKRGGYRQGGLAFVISIATALIAFGAAHVLAGNGFLAAYIAGLVAGNRNYAAKRTISTFQDGMAWLAQVAMFLTLGLLVTPSELGPAIGPGFVITAILMFVARPISVFLCLAPFRQFGWRSKLFVSWAGLRGAVPIVLATFPIVAGVEGAFAIFNIVFFVVLLSSVIQGPTINWAARKLRIGEHDERVAVREAERSGVARVRSAKRELDACAMLASIQPMSHHTPLIATIVAALVVAFVMGTLAHRLRVSPVAGYLFAGVIIGPFTPGFVADAELAIELAEIGVILLMFGVGLHFSLKDLLSVRRIAVPGALAQIAGATALGLGLALLLGWSVVAGLVFGLALSVASTVVLLRALQARDAVNTERGKIAVGWLIVEDLAMVLALVMLPVIADLVNGTVTDRGAVLGLLLVTICKVAGFIALMLIVGKRVIPAGLHWVAHTGSRELFRLAVLSIALGVAFGAAALFDVSFALGAFFAGMILGESQLSRRAAEETLPLRDAFAVLFFVSVGMLFDPAVVVEQPWPLVATVAIIIFGKSLIAYLIVRAFGHPNETALTVSASLAQIGEFSFILAGLGTGLGILPPEARDLILAGAILSILANPLIFSLAVGRAPKRSAFPTSAPAAPSPTPPAPAEGHTILVGFGRVGRLVTAAHKGSDKLVVIEAQAGQTQRDGSGNLTFIEGNAADPAVLEQAEIGRASRLLLAIPGGFEAGAIAQNARALNPVIQIIARAHSDDDVAYLERVGADHVIMGEREIAARMVSLIKAP